MKFSLTASKTKTCTIIVSTGDRGHINRYNKLKTPDILTL